MDVDTGEPTIWTQGFDRMNHRRLTAEQVGLTTRDMGNLELAWAMGFPSTANMRSQPAIVGNTMYYPIVDSASYLPWTWGAEPCVKWVYECMTSLCVLPWAITRLRMVVRSGIWRQLCPCTLDGCSDSRNSLGCKCAGHQRVECHRHACAL